MNRIEYLMLCLAEELGEVQKESLKCLRFTLDKKESEDAASNFERLQTEWSEVVAIVELLNEEGIRIRTSSAVIESKKIRTEHYYELSRKFGVVK
jgi:hypothetical protein